MRRKSQLQDLIFVPVILLAFAIVVFFLLNIVTSLRGSSSNTANQNVVLDYQGYTLKGFDSMNVFIFVVILLLIGGIAYAVRSSPIGMAIVIFIGLAIVMLGAMFSNIYTSIASDAGLVQSANQFPLTFNLFDKLPIFVGVGVLIILVFLFGKPQIGGQ